MKQTWKKFTALALLFIIFYIHFFYAEGFSAGTLIKTLDGYIKIEALSVGDCVLCVDDEKNFVETSLIGIEKKYIDSYMRVQIADEYLSMALDQKIYDETQNVWIDTISLKDEDILAHHPIAIELIKEPIDVYLLTVSKYHNFFVSSHDICAHNFVPIVVGITLAFGTGSLEIAGISCGIAGLGTYLGYQWKKNKQKHMLVAQIGYGGGMMPEDPEEEKKRKRDEARDNYESLNNKEAKELAEKMGFKIDKNPPVKSYGKLVFRKGNTYISADRTGHKGGVWKVFIRGQGRVGTWNVDLTQRIGD